MSARAAALLLLIAVAAFGQDERRVASPDGQIEFRLFEASQPDSNLYRIAYQVSYRNKKLIDTSFLGFDIYEQEPLLGESAGLMTADIGKGAGFNTLTSHYMQNGSLGRLLDIEVRVYNDGVAFRYRIPKSTPLLEIQIADEATEFDLVHPADAPLALSFVTEQKGVGWVAIAEVPIAGYPRMNLKHEEDGILLARLTRHPGIPDIVFEGKPPLVCPWRVIVIGQDKSRLLESKVLTDLKAGPVASQ